ncbi:MAG: glycosyltransferase family 39 protein [Candidatus Omnitrophica bacterium]|nr:glycosyltransferase family 39 protein [Candidatus Omnitrophota bacterium]
MNGQILRLAVIVVVAIIVRIVCFLYYQAHSGIEPFEYEIIAENLIQGKGFIIGVHGAIQRAAIAPVYPALCAIIYLLLGHHHSLVIFLQIAFNAGICIVIFSIARRIFDLKCAYFSAILVALHPGMIIYSATKLHSLSFYSFLICGSILLLVISLKRNKLSHKIILGILSGICVLERATFLPFFVLAWVWLLYYSIDKKEAKNTIIISIISVILIVSPWVIRNTIIFKRFVFIQTNQWWGFWAGNNPKSSGTLYMPSGKTAIEESPEEFHKKLFSLDEIGQMELFKTTALTFVRKHPVKFGILTAKKFYYFWWFSPQAGFLYPSAYLAWYKIYYSVVLLFSIIGLIVAFYIKIARPLINLILLLFISNSILHSFYYLEGRHRWSMEPLLFIFFSFGFFKTSVYIRKLIYNVRKRN